MQQCSAVRQDHKYDTSVLPYNCMPLFGNGVGVTCPLTTHCGTPHAVTRVHAPAQESHTCTRPLPHTLSCDPAPHTLSHMHMTPHHTISHRHNSFCRPRPGLSVVKHLGTQPLSRQNPEVLSRNRWTIYVLASTPLSPLLEHPFRAQPAPLTSPLQCSSHFMPSKP